MASELKLRCRANFNEASPLILVIHQEANYLGLKKSSDAYRFLKFQYLNPT